MVNSGYDVSKTELIGGVNSGTHRVAKFRAFKRFSAAVGDKVNLQTKEETIETILT